MAAASYRRPMDQGNVMEIELVFGGVCKNTRAFSLQSEAIEKSTCALYYGDFQNSSTRRSIHGNILDDS